MYDKETFIKEAIKKHGNKYDYKLVDYHGCDTKVCIVCPKHGKFWQTPYNHVYGFGCKGCANDRLRKLWSCKSAEAYLQEAYRPHLFDYRESYINCRQKVAIKCKTCGKEFKQAWREHKRGHGCPFCSMEKSKTALRLEPCKIMTELNSKLSNKFDFSESVYINNKTPLLVKCNKCGKKLKILVSNLKAGHGCGYCTGNRGYNLERFLNRIKNKPDFYEYDYSEAVYINTKTKIKITHSKCGNSFYQTPNNHLRKSCPFCQSSKGQTEIAALLRSNNINFEIEKSFAGLTGIGGGLLRFDFYLPDYNVLLEYDGKQHYEWIPGMMTKSAWERLLKHDRMKDQFAKNHRIKLIRLSYLDRPFQQDLLSSLLLDS